MSQDVDNPFTAMYTALWDLAAASEYLSSLIRLKNRIRFDYAGQSSPIKDVVSNADLPELMLVATSGTPSLRNTSSSSMITRNYEWILSTGDMSVSNKLLDVEWAIFCAMVDWPDVVTALQWNGSRFVKRCAFTDLTVGQSDPERNRGIEGWSSVWALEVEMHFKTSDLQLVNAPGTGS